MQSFLLILEDLDLEDAELTTEELIELVLETELPVPETEVEEAEEDFLLLFHHQPLY